MDLYVVCAVSALRSAASHGARAGGFALHPIAK